MGEDFVFCSVCYNYTQIYVGETHTCIAQCHEIFCFGQNTYGESQPEQTNGERFVLLDTYFSINVPNGWFVKEISLGPSVTCIVYQNGKAYCFGSTYFFVLNNY